MSVQHEYFKFSTDKGESWERVVLSVDMEALARRLFKRAMKSKRGIAQSNYGAIQLERMRTAEKGESDE